LVTLFSIIGTNFPGDKGKYFGYIEAAVGLGLIVGPPLGSFMYG
jgi:MFS family permease